MILMKTNSHYAGEGEESFLNLFSSIFFDNSLATVHETALTNQHGIPLFHNGR